MVLGCFGAITRHSGVKEVLVVVGVVSAGLIQRGLSGVTQIKHKQEKKASAVAIKIVQMAGNVIDNFE